MCYRVFQLPPLSTHCVRNHPCMMCAGALTGYITLKMTLTNGPVPANVPVELYSVFGTNHARNAVGSNAKIGASVTTLYFYLLQNALSFVQQPAYVSRYPSSQPLVAVLNYTANVTGYGDYSTADGDQIVMICQSNCPTTTCATASGYRMSTPDTHSATAVSHSTALVRLSLSAAPLLS